MVTPIKLLLGKMIDWRLLVTQSTGKSEFSEQGAELGIVDGKVEKLGVKLGLSLGLGLGLGLSLGLDPTVALTLPVGLGIELALTEGLGVRLLDGGMQTGGLLSTVQLLLNGQTTHTIGGLIRQQQA